VQQLHKPTEHLGKHAAVLDRTLTIRSFVPVATRLKYVISGLRPVGVLAYIWRQVAMMSLANFMCRCDTSGCVEAIKDAPSAIVPGRKQTK